ncbi:MAG: S1 RNA-binding domain-containing protein [Phycisphaerales bacterium]
MSDDGTVMVSSTNRENVENAEAEISALCEDVRPGTIYEGKVVSTKDFGAFIEIAPGTDGMCHISELADGYVENVNGRQGRRHRQVRSCSSMIRDASSSRSEACRPQLGRLKASEDRPRRDNRSEDRGGERDRDSDNDGDGEAEEASPA